MNKFYRFLFALCSFNSFIVDDAAGGSDDDIDIDDIDIDDEDDANTDSNSNDNSNNNDESNSTSLEDTVKALQAKIQAREDADLLTNTLNELGEKHKGFDSSKVKDYLVELNKTDPERANALNNPIGFENIWLTQFRENTVDNDNPNFGRNVKPVDRSEEINEKISSGETLTIQDEIAFYGKDL